MSIFEGRALGERRASEECPYTTPWVVMFGVLCAVGTWGVALALVFSLVEAVKTFPIQWAYTVIIWALTGLFPVSLLVRKRFVRLRVRVQWVLAATIVFLVTTALVLIVVGAAVHGEL